MMRTASNASAASTARPVPRDRGLAQAGQDDADVLRLMWQRRVEHRDLVVGGPAIGRDEFDAPGLFGRLHHLGDGEQRGIDAAPGYVAHQRFQQPG